MDKLIMIDESRLNSYIRELCSNHKNSQWNDTRSYNRYMFLEWILSIYYCPSKKSKGIILDDMIIYESDYGWGEWVSDECKEKIVDIIVNAYNELIKSNCNKIEELCKQL